MKKIKLTEAEIQQFEKWAENKKKGPMTAEEKTIVNSIESASKNNWAGERVSEDNVTSMEEAKRKFERLQRGV